MSVICHMLPKSLPPLLPHCHHCSMKAMSTISRSNLQDAVECAYLRCVDDLDGPMNNSEEYSLFQICLPFIHTLSITKGCVYCKLLAGVHFSSMVLYHNSNTVKAFRVVRSRKGDTIQRSSPSKPHNPVY
ncbi:uncharacterized protein LACBIDRAFT_299566 [Laccaria bicolor S238N-H82]|uniref:Predicted protein n=1 Tax=Laccaria bicolor (strain S238N-H82 / ATCC MYA-4686) TaxID=486041 RepID=B0DEV6_LACBS|nr:uncharacterized protein LACBIDRAFT_299566 [Laccaria bicolor S238N-H82]EDR06739.1 predicted protein [Laccaria bicolor S238N-H82]|eukprot:XP_001882586.1 predicted protein [Laccaria bicolor S238N-H82]